MYSEEFDNNTSYNDEQYVDYEEQVEQKPSFWNENKGLIIKIIIVVLCVAILIWLILKLQGNSANNGNHQNSAVVYANNVDTIRLAAEKYFFIEGNMPTENEVAIMTLDELTGKGYVSEIVDANKNKCDGSNSSVTLVKGEQSYVMTINLVCSNTSNPQVYNYSLEKKVCLDCTGFTYMDGSTNNENTEEDNNDNDDNNTNEEDEVYSCQVWSDWTDEKLNDDTLEVRMRVLIKGFKKGEDSEKITYGEWSEYTTTAIKPTENLEVEMIAKKEQVWVTKTSDKEVKESSTIKDVKKTTTGGSYSYCPSGYTKENNQCVKTSEVITGDLTPIQYNTYNVINKPCGGISYKDGSMVYKNCKYTVKETTSLKWGNNSKTTYTYQELETKEVTYYRSRTKVVETVYADPIITDYMEEKDLPEGYSKVEGSEKTQYSYKLKDCEK